MQSTDHPRGCGEHDAERDPTNWEQGSSPRMRGALVRGGAGRFGVGIIPADAGSTPAAPPPADPRQDHPRGCGEHRKFDGRRDSADGSSPRMRGARSHVAGMARPRGIIPADAGSTRAPARRSRGSWDHPRGCGEHPHRHIPHQEHHGSSPRMRGALELQSEPGGVHGIIPADAGSTRTAERAWWCPWDHPRGCGEHDGGFAKLTEDQGSSPRMRGALPDPGGDLSTIGIIPADAGSTQRRAPGVLALRDHPRGCGEHKSLCAMTTSFAGSSPRMRGAQKKPRPLSATSGIIPADAGSTGPRAARSGCPWDHPRGCGEHVSPNERGVIAPGSSPRMRGARRYQSRCGAAPGIIPADAGSTGPARRSGSSAPDHPRGCGEHRVCALPENVDPGSSPRMRGARTRAYRSSSRIGIIPADAGSTESLRGGLLALGDHPRGCGEHRVCALPENVDPGSSPRMRGAPVVLLFSLWLLGIIPADAGSTCGFPSPSETWRDHPRGCGEHTVCVCPGDDASGSSPRMRGAQPVDGAFDPSDGIIPADAGSTPWRMRSARATRDHPRGCGEHARMCSPG